MTNENSNGVKNSKSILLSILNSIGVFFYILAVVLFIGNAEKMFGKVDNHLLAPMIMLLLFVLSALVTGSLVLGRPIYLYLEGRKTESLKMLFYTAICLAVILALVILTYLGIK